MISPTKPAINLSVERLMEDLGESAKLKQALDDIFLNQSAGFFFVYKPDKHIIHFCIEKTKRFDLYMSLLYMFMDIGIPRGEFTDLWKKAEKKMKKDI